MLFAKGNTIWLGKKHTEETKKKISLANIGKHQYKHTEETKRKLSNSHKGQIPWNKGIKRGPNPEQSKRMMGNTWNKGKTISEEVKSKIRETLKGRRISKETRQKNSVAQKRRVAEGRHNLWKGGITPANLIIRQSLEYKLWRESVFQRDNWTCIWCGSKSVKEKRVILHADHIKPFCDYPELRFAIDNGRTLCVDCHKKTDTFAQKINKTICQ